MKRFERAIEILNPEHREYYESIEPVNEACRMGMKALEKQIPKKTVMRYADIPLRYCPCCNVRFIGWGMKYCGECGQALDWGDSE